LACLLLFGVGVQAQQKQKPTLEDIIQKGLFSQSGVYGINWMKDGRYYTSLKYDRQANATQIVKYDVTTGQPVATLVDGSQLKTADGQPLLFSAYSLSADENQVLLTTESEQIYRRSSKANFYLYNLQTKELKPLNKNGKVGYATFSPDGNRIAYVRDNNLYYQDLASGQETAVTTDGKINETIYGSADWVYEEEFSFAQAFKWAPDSKHLAYYRFNEANVREFNMPTWTKLDEGSLYPEDYLFKYPKAGEDNAEVDIYVYNTENKNNVKIDIGPERNQYIPRIYWTNSAEVLALIRMNRLQNKLELLHANPSTGSSQVIITENSETYVDLDYNDNLVYLKDNKGFIMTSERSGFKHIYLYKMDGTLERQITSGDWEVTEMVGYDEKRKIAYFISAEDGPLERQFYRIDSKGKKKVKLSEEAGVVTINMSPDYSYYIQSHSSAKQPTVVTLHQAPSGEQLKVLEDNADVIAQMEQYSLNLKEFFNFTTTDGKKLNGYMIRPSDFDATKQYPVLMYVYGGPGSQTVMNNFSGGRELWHSYLAEQGYIIVSVDNRGTGARGRDFKHMTYAQLGKYEVEDQIAAAKYLANQPYIDGDRIGIWGWSYGGYMSSLALMLGNDVFKTAIAVAPVTNWRYYDTIYTERYLKTPQENAEGYDAYSPLSHVDKLEGNFLLIHGTGDDNVHFQNAVALQDALIKAGKQFSSFYYPNRNHGIYGGNTRLHLFQMITNYLEQNL
jgi:dipeptidyl-peptidase-4